MRTPLPRSLVLGTAAVGMVAAGLGVAVPASGATPKTASAPTYTFSEHRDHNDLTFNQLLGINDLGQIAGYFGIGTSATVHPNRGYVLDPPYRQADFINENFPGAAQTQVIGINNSGTTVGFYADAAGDNFGFVLRGGIWTAVIDPHTGAGTVNQLLGVNNHGVAVGFYVDGAGHSHGYEFNFHTDAFTPVNIPGATDVTASGINFAGDVTGFYTEGGATRSFLLVGHKLTRFSAPGSSNTMALGINNHNEIVGQYVLGSGSSAVTHGFVRPAGTLHTVNDPAGVNATTINGVNDSGDLVGFYTDSVGNTDGFLARPS